MEWELIRGWALINFLDFQGGRLFEVGAYSKVNKSLIDQACSGPYRENIVPRSFL